MIKVFLLSIWINSHGGYLVVQDLPSKAACDALYARLVSEGAVSRGKDHWCTEYEKSK